MLEIRESINMKIIQKWLSFTPRWNPHSPLHVSVKKIFLNSTSHAKSAKRFKWNNFHNQSFYFISEYIHGYLKQNDMKKHMQTQSRIKKSSATNSIVKINPLIKVPCHFSPTRKHLQLVNDGDGKNRANPTEVGQSSLNQTILSSLWTKVKLFFPTYYR